MIEIKDKKDCCGCHACTNVCPKQCITMQTDEEGFLYPVVDKVTCIGCGLCEKVCPVINQSEPRKPLRVYAAKNKNEEIRTQSSSGGIFTLLAEKVIIEGGVVFGAKFDENWNVIHSWTDTIEGIAVFRGSKYVQSTIGDTFREAKNFLLQDRKVLFTGTPCQIAGLKKYLRKDYENLLCVSIACHGVPSPIVWQEFLKEKRIDLSNISSISMRNKQYGWRNYQLCIKDKSGNCILSNKKYNCSYLHGFIRGFYLRPSCYSCKTKAGSCGCDFLIADFWGIEDVLPQYDDNKGISLVIAYSDKAQNIAKSMDLPYTVSTEQAFHKNPCIIHSTQKNENTHKFWEMWSIKGYEANNILLKQYKKTLASRILTKIKSILQ